MSRIAIYVVYDGQCVINEYIDHVLRELRRHVQYLIVVCNFQNPKSGTEYVRNHADRLICRENKGFDAGAYKDVICAEIGNEFLEGYDELLLINDSFYAPIFPFDEMFGRMDDIDCDYWGMTRFPGGTYEGSEIGPHIQSFFICIRSSIMRNQRFWDFWTNLSYPTCFAEAVFSFEYALNELLVKNGYSGMAYAETNKKRIALLSDENPYMKYPLSLIKDCRVPVVKRKAFSLNNEDFENACMALDYIKKHSSYNYRLIVDHLRYVSQYSISDPGYNLVALDSFMRAHKRIFIYGAGRWGRNTSFFFRMKGWRHEGFIVSDDSKESANIISIERVVFERGDGMVIATGSRQYAFDMYELASRHMRREHIFLPNHCIGCMENYENE